MGFVVSYSNGILISLLVIVPTAFGLFRMPAEMGIATAAISLALAFRNLDKFEKFKAPGFEAELRTAVEKTYAALEELKDLSLAVAAPIVDTLAITGVMLKYIPLKYKLQRVEKIRETLRKLGATEEEITKACSTMYDRLEADHRKRILLTLLNANGEKKQLFDGLDGWDTEEWDRARIQRFIEEHGLTKSKDVEAALLDLDHYSQTKTLRRPDAWQS